MHYRFFITLVTVVFVFGAVQAGSWRILLPDTPSAAERTAAAELTDYLNRSIRGDLTVDGQENVRIRLGIAPDGVSEALPEEAWRITGRDGDLYIYGGGDRGTLYGVYRFLEDVVGVRWWNPAEEYVPAHDRLELASVELSGRPFFRQRSLFREPYGVLQDHGRFAARSRLNPDGHWPIGMQYGGSTNIGSPHQVHTFSWYFPEELFAAHPEYFALRDGKRRCGMFEQLCLSNPEVERIFLEKLKAYIVADEAEARENDTLPPAIYDISQNDNSTPCECPACQAIAAEEGSEMGPVIRLVNRLAAAVAEFRPGLKLSTLAYNYTEKPAQTPPGANVIIRLCDTASLLGWNYSEQPEQYFLRTLEAWSAICDELYVWTYGITYGGKRGMPFANEFTFAETHRTWADYGVKYVFWEHEDPDIADMVTLKSYLEIKLMEDPYRDFEELYRDFMDKYYGAAAEAVEQCRRELFSALRDSGDRIGFMAEMSEFRYLTYPVLLRAHDWMDRAETAVAGQPEYLQRVRQARLSLDRYTYLNLPQLYRQHCDAGGDPEQFPWAKDTLIDRVWSAYRAGFPTLNAARVPEFEAKIDREIANVRNTNERLAPPAFFRDDSRVRLDFPASALTLRGDTYRLVTVPEAESGMAVAVPLSPERPESPLLFGAYSYGLQEALYSGYLPPPSSDGFQWQRFLTFELAPDSDAYLYFTSNWEIQIPMQEFMRGAPAPQQWEGWVSLKYEPERLLIERIVLFPETVPNR